MEDIHKFYGKVTALQAVDLLVYPGEIIGLVGDNGAGKSTLIKILSGVLQPDRGRIFVDGRPVRFRSSRDAMAAGIETIHQKAALVDTLDVKRNIFLGREPVVKIGPFKVLNLPKMAKDAVAAVDKVGLRLRSPHASVRDLSGGQRQAVAIARAMHFQSRLLVLDEPTNNMSVKESHKVLDYITMLKEQGIASIFITHNLNHVYSIADRLVVMRLGEKLADLRREETSIQELTELMSA